MRSVDLIDVTDLLFTASRIHVVHLLTFIYPRKMPEA